MNELRNVPLDALLGEIRRRCIMVEMQGPDPAPVPVRGRELDQIAIVVCAVHEIPAQTLAESRRTKRVANARQQFCAIVKGLHRDMTFQEIADYLKRDHGTVIHAIRAHKKYLKTDRYYAESWREVVGRLEELQCRTSPQAHSASTATSA